MGDMLSTGVSGLLAFQTALDTISNNISNVNTTGYSEETTNLVTNPATATNNGWIGNGVSVSDVTRSYSDFLDAQTRNATSSYNQFNTAAGLADSINNMFGDPTSGLSATLQSFSQAIQTMANSPSQSSARAAVLTQAQTVISQFQSYQANLSQLGGQVNTQVQSEASTINSLAQNIASLNQQIMAAQNNGSSQSPNSLLDQRNNLIDQLSQNVSVNTVQQSDGSLSVFIGSGQALVVGAQAGTLTTGPDQFNSGQLDLSLKTASGSVDITNQLSGGAIGGLLQFRSQMLLPGENALGQAAVTLTNLLNTQNQAGLDQNGNVGAALMAVGGPQALASSHNAGTASVTASISNLAALTTSNYYLTYDGSNWNMTDSASGAAVTPLTASTAGGVTTLTGAGLTLSVSGTASAGDKFLVEPTGNAVNGLSLLTNDPSKIAAAGPLVTSATVGNTGSASIASATVPNTSGYTRGNYTLSFTTPTAYTVTDASGAPVSTGTYTAGTPITFNGISVALAGAPAAGDSFAIDDNANGTGDNSNALKLAGILNQNVLNGGAESLSGAVNSYVGTVGLLTSQVQNGATAQQSVMQSAQSAQQSLSGVNLDQEAANLVQYQQAYQAAAQVIAASNTLFNSLLTAINGVG
ncbi:MAG TPA: flagellar hook-associated protein FlgK [Steroidobacteraceae bacterium]|jgi:flagellar hook-associated protein 1 FlgK